MVHTPLGLIPTSCMHNKNRRERTMSKLLTIGICVAIALTLLTGMRSGTVWPIWGPALLLVY
jgi:hypothetical protein